MSGETPIHCPLVHEPPGAFVPCDPWELDPLVAWLTRLEAGDERLEFPRGVIEDGRLDLCKQALGPEGAQRILLALDTRQEIRSILLGTNALHDEGARSVGEAMRRNRNLETVYLGCNGITARGLESLCSAIEDGAGTSALWLKRNPIGLPGAERLAHMLQRPHSLRTLDLVNTGLGDEGACRVLRSIMASPQGLERLYLGGNGLTATSATVASDLLAKCPGITAFYLGTNHLRDSGATVVAEGLRGNQTLRELSLAANGLSAKGASALFTALGGHPAFEILDLGSTPSARVLEAPTNQINSDALEALVSFIDTSSSLSAINLRDNALDAETATKILDACERHPMRPVIQLEGNPCNRRIRKRAAALAQSAPPFPERAEIRAIRSKAR
jgi:Ran GTPase-activating protein (RanGAP) involved in mRNA processing and transport